jgi:hypothetical protein
VDTAWLKKRNPGAASKRRTYMKEKKKELIPEG